MAKEKISNENIKVGAIFCATHGYDMRLPEWLMVVKKNGKQSVTLQPIDEIIISGSRNGYWKSMPDTAKPIEKPFMSRLYKGWNGIAVKDAWGDFLYEWDGKSALDCDDQD